MSRATEHMKRAKGVPSVVSCDGKVAFPDHAAATAVLNRKARTKRPGRSAYHCAFCSQWHLGVDKGRVQVKRATEFKQRRQGQ